MKRGSALGGFTLRALLVSGALCASLALAVSACGDDSCSEGAEDGPLCCADGCGRTTTHALPAVCKNGEWTCQGSNPVFQKYCAKIAGSCEPREACTGIVGLGNEEPDPAPELCCKGGCNGTEAVHRVCKTGTTYDCPDGAVEISRCPSPLSACGGAINKYRSNDHKLESK